MASSLVIEDGTNVPTADSYISVADADTYCAKFGLDSWTAKTEAQKDVLLRKATQYIDQTYLNRWKGHRTYTDQPLQWPRDSVYQYESLIDDDVIPEELKSAIVEAAVKFIDTDLTQDEGRKTQSESVGTLSVTYALNAKNKTVYTRIDMLLESLLTGKNTTPIYRS